MKIKVSVVGSRESKLVEYLAYKRKLMRQIMNLNNDEKGLSEKLLELSEVDDKIKELKKKINGTVEPLVR